MFQKYIRLIFPIVLLAAASPSAWACRYSVRDVGFVEIHPAPYRLRFFEEAIGSATRLQELLAVSRLALEGTNVVVEKGTERAERTEGTSGTDSPTVLLESPDPEIAPLAHSGPVDSWRFSPDTLASSKVRERYLERMLDIYAAILFVESVDARANEDAMAGIDSAIAQTKEYMTKIPKPVNAPPEAIAIPSDDSEEVLLWSLGVTDRTIPHVAVLFGRGRRIGEVLSGSDITAENLFEILSVVGLDCECGLDRSWMQGTCAPLRWDEETQERVAKALDFDPENPVAKMEISQILSQGGLGTRRSEGGDSDPFLGYSERSLTFEELDFETEDVETDRDSPSSASATVSIEPPEKEPSALARSFPAAPIPSNPESGSYFLGLGILISLGLSIFAVGFYILLRARRLEP